MAPAILAALITSGTSLAGLNWKQILEGKNTTMQGWHGLSAEAKNTLSRNLINDSFNLAKENGLNPSDIYWTAMKTYIFRPSEDTLSKFLGVNPYIKNTLIPQFEGEYSHSFYEAYTKAEVTKQKIKELTSNKYLIFGAVGVFLLFIISILFKKTAKA